LEDESAMESGMLALALTASFKSQSATTLIADSKSGYGLPPQFWLFKPARYC
jgi:hypothetical protein